jgi:hypothetical protein
VKIARNYDMGLGAWVGIFAGMAVMGAAVLLGCAPAPLPETPRDLIPVSLSVPPPCEVQVVALDRGKVTLSQAIAGSDPRTIDHLLMRYPEEAGQDIQNIEEHFARLDILLQGDGTCDMNTCVLHLEVFTEDGREWNERLPAHSAGWSPLANEPDMVRLIVGTLKPVERVGLRLVCGR